MDRQKELQQLTNEQSAAIKELLGTYNDDPVKAVHGLRTYLQQHKETPQSTTVTSRETSSKVIISVKDVKKSYKISKQTVNALAGVTLDIHEGEFIAITGASGSGKSTLLQLLGGLDKPTSGDITINDTLMSKMSDRDLSRFRNTTIGFVFQFFYLQPFLKIRKNIEVPAMFANIKRSERQAHIEKISAAVGLSERLDHLPRELSGGQMQRAAIARALLNNPKVLLADEPTGNLDSTNSSAIIDLFEKIRRDFNTTVIVVTHDPAIARRADREIKLKDGSLL